MGIVIMKVYRELSEGGDLEKRQQCHQQTHSENNSNAGSVMKSGTCVAVDIFA